MVTTTVIETATMMTLIAIMKIIATTTPMMATVLSGDPTESRMISCQYKAKIKLIASLDAVIFTFTATL